LIDDGIRDEGSFDMFIDITGHAHRFEEGDPGDDGHFEVSDLFRKGFEDARVVNRIRHEEVNTQSNLLLHIHEFEVEDMTFRRRVDQGAYAEPGLSLEIVSHEVITLLQAFGGSEEPHDIQVKDGLGFEMISDGWMLAVEEQNIRHPQGRGIEQFRLEGQPVSSAAGEVIDDLHPFGLQEGTDGKGSQTHDGILEVWDVDRIDSASQELRIFIKFREVVPFGRLEFHNHRKFP
jgi:hypothetical protein